MADHQGFKLPDPISFDLDTEPTEARPIYSEFSKSAALTSAQLISLADGEGSLLYYKRDIEFEVGDVIFLRERRETHDAEDSDPNMESRPETGLVVQVVSLGTANYPQADTKALFRLMVNVRASSLQRSHNEPKEIVDEFLVAEFKVRAEIRDGEWTDPEGRVVTRNVDIFELDPALLCSNILTRFPKLNLNLGDYKRETISFFGGGFEKINLITGMKGGGKSHIAKGVIAESLRAGMSAVVFDINDEYQQLPNSRHFVPGVNLRFRLDRIKPKSFLNMVNLLAKFSERTELPARAGIYRILDPNVDAQNKVKDIEGLKSQASNIIEGNKNYQQTMRASFKSSLDVVKTYNLLMTKNEADEEDQFIKDSIAGKQPEPPEIVSLTSAMYEIDAGHQPGVIIFDIGGMIPVMQYVVVDLIMDSLKELCRRQTYDFKKGNRDVPNYPTVYFEEAHMYMKSAAIDELLPLIRHHGMNVFFITNTPDALPDSVFRLMDNLIMTRMLNKRDIDQVKNCGLTDAETIEGFARNLKTHHALLLSGKKGTTNGFPLVFHVRNFHLPESGETRSMWKAMKDSTQSKQDNVNET